MPTKRSSRTIGEMLIEAGVITPEQLWEALNQQRLKAGEPLCATLARLGLASEERLMPVLAKQLSLSYVSLPLTTPTPSTVLEAIPARLATRYQVLPIARDGQTLTIAMADPLDTRILDELKVLTRCRIQPALAGTRALQEAIRQQYGVGAETVEAMVANRQVFERTPELAEAVEDLDAIGGEASTIKFTHQLLAEAFQARATDVHLEPYEHAFMIRYRIDGILYDVPVPADLKRFQASIISRVKVMAHLDVAEHRLPQDGRAKVKIGGRDLDLRVSILPTPYGEAVMIRFLSTNVFLGLEQLGLLPDHLTVLERMLAKPHGIIFVTGPTGSGKTTTLYACLAKLNDRTRKIITVEDPIEYVMPGITQCQVHPKIEFTFARALRSMLRHDPDIMMVGEVRDLETAETTIRTALTGHLVFSTLHTNDAPSSVARLLDMGVEPFLVASSLECAIAQRLVRLICPECKGAKGSCCRMTGFRGRTAIFEFFAVDDAVRELIVRRAPADEIRRVARTKGMRTMREDGLEKVRRGLTTEQEVLRVTQAV